MYKKRENGWEKHLDFMLLDILCMAVAFFNGYTIRHGLGGKYFNEKDYWRLFVVLIVLDLAVGLLRQSYENIVRRGYLVEFKEVFVHTSVIDVWMLIYLFLMRMTDVYSRESLLLYYVAHVGLTYIVRCIWKYHLRKQLLENPKVEQMLVLVDDVHEKTCLRHLTQEIYGNYHVTGLIRWNQRENHLSEKQSFSKEFKDVERVEGIPVVCERHQLAEYILNHVVDSVFINIEEQGEEVEQLVERLVECGVTVHVNLKYVTSGLHSKSVEKMGNYTVLTSSTHMADSRQLWTKRGIDILGGIIGCTITIFLMVIFGPIIYIQSPGPIFFKQNRVGKNGRIFNIYKFRSMYPDAEKRKEELMEQNEMQGFMFKMKDDPRIIPIGRFMRKYSLDEFPQFFNVLRGEMSLVGTRPPTVDEFEQYHLHHRSRLSGKPGITGLWQISGRSDITDFEEVVRLDVDYMRDWSVGNDVKIIARTVLKMVRGEGAK